MATCKNFNTITSVNISKIKNELLQFERYAFTHDYYHCTIELCDNNFYSFYLIHTFSYDIITYSNLTLEYVCLILQSHNISESKLTAHKKNSSN